MAIQEHDRKSMAFTQLETALRLFFEGRDHYSVITLAGAADETFGQILKADGRQSSLATLTEATAAIHLAVFGAALETKKEVGDRANHARNALKHWDPSQPLGVSFDAVEEAEDMLDRAIGNSWRLEHRLSPAMERFQREVMGQ
jgi:hypothetical protein